MGRLSTSGGLDGAIARPPMTATQIHSRSRLEALARQQPGMAFASAACCAAAKVLRQRNPKR